MKAALKLGPADHGRPLSYEAFLAGDFVEGYRYELIDGRLCVAPAANLSEDSVREWLADARFCPRRDVYDTLIAGLPSATGPEYVNAGPQRRLGRSTTRPLGTRLMPDAAPESAPLLAPAFLTRLEQLELVSRKIFMGR